MDIKVGKEAIYKAARELSNWGRWGPDDQIGTLNHVTPEAIVHAGSLIRRVDFISFATRQPPLLPPVGLDLLADVRREATPRAGSGERSGRAVPD